MSTVNIGVSVRSARRSPVALRMLAYQTRALRSSSTEKQAMTRRADARLTAPHTRCSANMTKIAQPTRFFAFVIGVYSVLVHSESDKRPSDERSDVVNAHMARFGSCCLTSSRKTRRSRQTNAWCAAARLTCCSRGRRPGRFAGGAAASTVASAGRPMNGARYRGDLTGV